MNSQVLTERRLHYRLGIERETVGSVCWRMTDRLDDEERRKADARWAGTVIAGAALGHRDRRKG